MRKATGFAGWSSLALALGTLVSDAAAQITEFTYSGGTGSQSWQSAANWGGGGFPNGDTHLANMTVPLGGNLSIGLGGTDVTVAGVKIGGSTGAVTTDITSTGGRLLFSNTFVQTLASADFSNNGVIDGADFLIWQRNLGATNQINIFNGDADSNGTVEQADLVIWKDNYGQSANGLNGGRAQIITTGITGSVNRISANVHLVNETVDVLGGTDLTINGNLSFEAASPTGGIDASISNTSRGITTTINGNIDISNPGVGDGAFGFNTSGASNGTLVLNGVISDGVTTPGNGGIVDVRFGVAGNGLQAPLNTIVINAANQYGGVPLPEGGGYTPSTTNLQRANIVVNNPRAFGHSRLKQEGPANQWGYNIIAGGSGLNGSGQLELDNDMIIAQWQTFRGDNSIKMTGDITQTNNRGIVNLISAGKTLELSGTIDIWEDPFDVLERRFVVDGTGTTVISGTIRDGDPDLGSSEPRVIVKTGTGVLRFNTAAGNVNHGGEMRVTMGNVHYANNDSLNVGAGLINSTGGAVGVDTGVANNATFMSKINPNSTGGLQLAASDATATLDFTGAMANAGKMTVAAPETGLTFTGTITPANSKYGLGGGTGKLTLPNAQLNGANALDVRNGGTVELLGANTYTGATRIVAKYASTNQDKAAADNGQNVNGLYYKEVAPTLVVNTLANGGSASSIGSASTDAANLWIQGSTLKYVGSGSSTNRLFTIGTGGATIDASGTGALMFTNSGALGRDDAENRAGLLNDLQQNPNEVYDVADTSDIIVGMPISDPGAPTSAGLTTGCGPGGVNCIPNPNTTAPWDANTPATTVTGISDGGTTIGLSQNTVLNIYKPSTLVFGTVPRTLTLAGSNGGNNTIASVIGNSAAGGVVNVEKTGAGKWVLSGANTYTGATIVRAGILSTTSAFLADTSTVQLFDGGLLNLNFAGTDIIAGLTINGTAAATGIWGAVGSGAAHTSPLLSGTGLLNVGGAAVQALAAVPEPASLALLAVALFGGYRIRRRQG